MVIVDIRTPEEYARGCVPGAISMPGGELVFRILELVKRADQPIVVHCGGRTRSYIGAESLRRMGLPNPIVALENGTMGWELAGLTLERGASRWPPAATPRSRAAAALVAKRVAAEDGIAFVSPEELRGVLARRSERNAYLLDVRTREEYAAAHIAGAVWVPGGQAVQATDESSRCGNPTIVLACDSFARATLTAAWLKRMGFPDVAVLAGGLPAWVQAGGATETRSSRPVAGWPRCGSRDGADDSARRPRRRRGHRRGPERRLRARPRAGSDLGLSQPAGGSHRDAVAPDRARAGGGDVRRRRRPRRWPPSRWATLGYQARVLTAAPARGRRPGGRSSAAPPVWPTSRTTSCPSRTSAAARPWKRTWHGRKRSTTRA